MIYLISIMLPQIRNKISVWCSEEVKNFIVPYRNYFEEVVYSRYFCFYRTKESSYFIQKTF